MTEVYHGSYGKTFQFNAAVEATATLLPKAETCGRLVQVRKGVGQFGSDVFLLRMPDGGLKTFENVGLVAADESLPKCDVDSTEVEYAIKGQWKHRGFIVEEPSQPKSYSPPFMITVTEG